jgi:hypothetical protein
MKPTLTKEEAKKITGLEFVQMPDTGDETVAVSYFSRPFVIVKDGTDFIPYWMSTGRGGKTNVARGKWYPVVGMSERWINKEGDGLIEYYGSKRLRKYAENLDKNLLFLNPDGSKNDSFEYELPVLKAECMTRFLELMNTRSPNPCQSHDTGNIRITVNMFLKCIHEKRYYMNEYPVCDEFYE